MILGLLVSSFLAVWEVVCGRKPVENFVTLAVYWFTIMSPLSKIARSFRSFMSALVDTERLLQIPEMQPSTKDPENSSELPMNAGYA